ncbi:hypothetical protein A6S26_33895 [Nostoc sp. ATCC 43529]|nr:hypothetical protein A6S26_33895 [Nostoc sp. ATCC 43529]
MGFLLGCDRCPFTAFTVKTIKFDWYYFTNNTETETVKLFRNKNVNSKINMKKIILCLMSLSVALCLILFSEQTYARNSGYEVWLSDQGNTQGITASSPNGLYGGKVRIYDSADLEQNPPINNPLVLDVVTDLFPNALLTTGADVNRIHGIIPTPDYKYMTLNFVASGHLGIVDGETKQPVCLFRSTATSTGRQNHMSTVSPDGTKILIANQSGRMLERVDIQKNTAGQVTGFNYNADGSIDMVGGTGRVLNQPIAVDVNLGDNISCTVTGQVADGQSSSTPNANPKQAAGVRPTNTVICPIISDNSQHAYVTLGGGGMFVVDITTAPMKIVAEYDLNVVHAAGCGGQSADGFMMLNTGTSAPNVSEFTLYRFTQDYPLAPNYNQPNQPLPVAVWADPDNGKIILGNNRDAHGMVIVKNLSSGEDKYLHQFDRVRNNAEVFQMNPPWENLHLRHEGTYSLTTTGACGTTLGAEQSNDPTPDLADLSLGNNGDKIYVALRGPNPLTIAHAAAGSCPGLGIIKLSPNNKSGELTNVLPTMIISGDSMKNLSDPHGAIVRQKLN